jgi:hypothetical protein
MIGSIGIDIQGSRAAVCLMEWAGGQVRQGPVGDGRRILIPVAATATSWGSPAAEEVLGALPAGYRQADVLDAWRQDAWSPQFLDGLHRRLLGFLGQTGTKGIRSHQVCVCTDPGSAADWATQAELLDQAGLPQTMPVRSADALLCRWLSETPAPPSGPVLAIACGETATIVGRYSVTIGEALVVHPDGETRVDAGSGRWAAEVAADALAQCRPDVPAHALLGLLDGVDEFAAMVRASTDDAWVEWAGPLSRYMFEPLRASRPQLAARATVTDFTRPITNAAYAILNGVQDPVTLLIGGSGAAWPFAGDALAQLGTVWQSGDPTLDLAYGACWWESYRRRFQRDGSAGSMGSMRSAPVRDVATDRTCPAADSPPLSGSAGPGPAGLPSTDDRAESPAVAFLVPPEGTASTGLKEDADLPWEMASAPTVTAPAPAQSADDDDVFPWERR